MGQLYVPMGVPGLDQLIVQNFLLYFFNISSYSLDMQQLNNIYFVCIATFAADQ